MERLAADFELRSRWAAGRLKVEEHYTWQGKIKQIFHLYREALAGQFQEAIQSVSLKILDHLSYARQHPQNLYKSSAYQVITLIF